MEKNSLTAEETIVHEPNSAFEITVSERFLTISGVVNEGIAVNISSEISEEKFVLPVDSTFNYEVLSVSMLTEFTRVVLKSLSTNDMLYIDCYNLSLDTANIEGYNQNWYTEFVFSEISEQSLPTSYNVNETSIQSSSIPCAYVVSNTKTYKSTTTIYGDIYDENIVLQFEYVWPDDMPKGTGGDFKLSLGILEKYTDFTPYNGNKTRMRGNSLVVNGGMVEMVTPSGEFFSTLRSELVGQGIRNGSVNIALAFGIHNTPLSIGVTLPSRVTMTNGENGFTSFSLMDVKGVMAARTDWSGMSFWLEKEDPRNYGSTINDKYVAIANLQTDSRYAVIGGKAFSLKWNYRVTSNGNCNGVAVNPYTVNDSEYKLLYYALIG